MGTPATIYSTTSTLYSEPLLDPEARAKPSKQDWSNARNLLALLEAQLPGSWSDNRFRQVEHYTSVPYIAIRAIMDLVGGASYQLMRRNREPKNTTTFAGNTVAKATASGQQQGRDEDYTPFDDYEHPLSELVRCPNPNESMGEFVARVVLQNRLTGVGPVWSVGSKADPEKPAQLWALRTPYLHPLPPSQTYPRGAWRIQPYNAVGWVGSLPFGLGSAGAVLPGEDVKRFLDPHPKIDWDGYSPLTAGAVQLDVFEAVETSRKSSMDRGTNLDAVMVAPGVGAEGVKALIEKFEARHMGADKARRTAVIDPGIGMEGKFSLQTLNSTPKDMDYATGWDQTLKFVLALFGVPPLVACLGEAGSYAEGYAARQQFYDRQEDFLHRLAVWFTREFCRPWESYPDEFVLKIKPRPIDDKEMSEQKHARQCQVGTITYNESRAKDDLPPVPDGDVPVPIYLAKLQQALAPQSGDGQGMEADAPDTVDSQDDGADVPDEMAAAALEELGVPQDEAVMKAGQYDESKHKRDHGKFSSTQGASGSQSSNPGGKGLEAIGGMASGMSAAFFDGLAASIAKTGEVPSTERSAKSKVSQAWDMVKQAGFHTHHDAAKRFAAAAKDAYNNGNTSQSWHDALNKNFAVAPSTPQPTAPATPSPRVSQVSQRAKASPAVKEQLTRAHEWADRMAEMHADRVAKHLGIDRASARHVLASTIKMLCDRALRGEGSSQSATYTGASGKKLTIGVKKKPGISSPSGSSGPHRPENPMGEGSLPPLPKSMNGLTGSEGGFLVPGGRMRKRKKGLKRTLGRMLKSLGA